MKKHQIVAAFGTIALAANLLLPNLAFGQQTGSLDVNCPGAGNPPTLSRVPANVTFEDASGLGVAGITNVTSSTSAQSAYDQEAANFTAAGNFPGGNTAAGDITSAARVTNDHLLGVRDQTSAGIDGCGGGAADNYGVSATITTLDGGGNKALTSAGTDKILASTIYIATTTKVDHTLINDNGTGGPTVDAVDGLYYNKFTTTGNPDLWTASGRATGADFTSNATYNTSGTALSNTAPLLTRCTGSPTGTNADITTGVAMVIDGGIHALQAQGSYSGTITYSIGTVAC